LGAGLSVIILSINSGHACKNPRVVIELIIAPLPLLTFKYWSYYLGDRQNAERRKTTLCAWSLTESCTEITKISFLPNTSSESGTYLLFRVHSVFRDTMLHVQHVPVRVLAYRTMRGRYTRNGLGWTWGKYLHQHLLMIVLQAARTHEQKAKAIECTYFHTAATVA